MQPLFRMTIMNSSNLTMSIDVTNGIYILTNLKEIASMAGITKRVFNKVGRHINAQLWVRYGAERPIISKMLGHQKEETTRLYF